MIEMKIGMMKWINKLILLVIIILPGTLFGQAQKNIDRQNKLSFSVNFEKVENITQQENDLYNLVVSADRKSIKNAERIYIQISDPEAEENLFITAINKDVLNGDVTNPNETFNKIQTSQDMVQLNFGPFEKGDYIIFIKIKDDTNNVYFNRKKISL